jgi:hypothetical protein
MKRRIGRFVLSVSLATAVFALAGSSVLAFECYNASRPEQGNLSAANSPALVSLDEPLVMFCGVDPAGTAAIKAALAAQGFRTDVLINFRTLMAQGLEKNGKGEEKLHDGQAIDHLSEEFFAALFTLVPSCE